MCSQIDFIEGDQKVRSVGDSEHHLRSPLQPAASRSRTRRGLKAAFVCQEQLGPFASSSAPGMASLMCVSQVDRSPDEASHSVQFSVHEQLPRESKPDLLPPDALIAEGPYTWMENQEYGERNNDQCAMFLVG